jgi:hypothetical protein
MYDEADSTGPVPQHHPGQDPRAMTRLRVGDLVIDQNTQRVRIDSKVEHMASSWDWSLAEALTVVDNGDGTHTVVEGQGRALALQLVDPDLTMPCLVLNPITSAAQSGVARDISRGRLAMSPVDRWKLDLNNGVAHEVAAQAVLESYGLRVARKVGARGIAAASTLRGIIRSGRRSPDEGAEFLNDVISVITAAYPDTDPDVPTSRFDAPILRAVADVLSRNADRGVDLDRLARKVAVRTPEQWLKLGKNADGPAVAAIADTMVNDYSKNLRAGRLA